MVVSLPLACVDLGDESRALDDSAGFNKSVGVAEEGRWKKRVTLGDEVRNPA
jgi:hypothetical protein